MPKRSGKTTKLINISAITGYYIVCCSQKRANEIQSYAKQLGQTIPFPLTFNEFLQKQYSTNIRAVLIDGADLLLESLSLVKIEAITINQELNK